MGALSVIPATTEGSTYVLSGDVVSGSTSTFIVNLNHVAPSSSLIDQIVQTLIRIVMEILVGRSG